MNCKDRNGNIIGKASSQELWLRRLYGSVIGRASLKILTKPIISKIVGSFLDSKYSLFLNDIFLEKNKIDRSQFEMDNLKCFNDCFKRKIKDGYRPIDENPEHLISPCDCKVSSYTITKDLTFRIKDSEYTVKSLLRDGKLAKKFEEGNITILRLSVDDYHRYCYIDSGVKTSNRFIPGVLHTVNPIACDYVKIYKENSREYTLMHTDHFGDVIQMEVGALFVGRIVNHHGKYHMTRGEEKGMFEYGGSTIVLITQKSNVHIDNDLLENTESGYETVVRMGERIGCTNNYSQNHSLTNS